MRMGDRHAFRLGSRLMQCNPTATTSTTIEHTVLYRNSRGSQMRWLARIGLLIACGVFVSIGLRCVHFISQESAAPMWSVASTGLGLLVALLALTFARNAWELGIRFVVHLEVWPQSHLAVIRTAGWWSERTDLVPWRDIRTARIAEPTAHASSPDPLVRVHLKSGATLIFDHAYGQTPHSWAALTRFLEKCSLPTLPAPATDRSETEQ